MESQKNLEEKNITHSRANFHFLVQLTADIQVLSNTQAQILSHLTKEPIEDIQERMQNEKMAILKKLDYKGLM